MSAETDSHIEGLLARGAVLLVPDGPLKPTEYGKRWMNRVWTDLQHHSNTLRDVARLGDPNALLDVAALGDEQVKLWAAMEEALREEGVPTNITSGISQYGMSHLIDHINGKTSFTMPATVAMALGTAAPTSTTTGATLTEAAYTGYARQTLAGSAFNAATAATPSVATNNGSITFGNCTAGTSTLLGFILADSATVAAGNALWYGTLASTVISTTQTPPTVASTAMSLSLTGT